MAMQLSQVGEATIKTFEAYRSEAYPDPATGGEPYTIGWGHTGGVKPGDTCTKAQAQAWFDEDVAQFVADVNSLVKVPLTQNQFDALVSFAFNCGSDIDADTIAEGLGDSTLLKKLNEGDYAGAAAEFPKWVKANGKIMQGLVNRREIERRLFERA